jgi:hypothetical protein
MGLVEQTRAVVEVGVPIVWADMTGDEFERKWRKVPLGERLVATGAAPVVGMYLRMFGSREFLARYLAVNDDTAIDNWNPESGLNKLVCDEREALLVTVLGEIHERNPSGSPCSSTRPPCRPALPAASGCAGGGSGRRG